MELSRSKKVVVIGVSFFIAAVITRAIPSVVDRPQVLGFTRISTLTVSENFDEFKVDITLAPQYFSSVGKFYVALSSHYSNSFENFKVEMSLDENNWTEVPLYLSLPDFSDTSKFADLGYINLNQFTITVYGKYSIPPQQLQLIPGISKEDVLNSFNGSLFINPIITGRDWVLIILLFISSWSLVLGILRFVLSNSD